MRSNLSDTHTHARTYPCALADTRGPDYTDNTTAALLSSEPLGEKCKIDSHNAEISPEDVRKVSRHRRTVQERTEKGNSQRKRVEAGGECQQKAEKQTTKTTRSFRLEAPAAERLPHYTYRVRSHAPDSQGSAVEQRPPFQSHSITPERTDRAEMRRDNMRC